MRGLRGRRLSRCPAHAAQPMPVRRAKSPARPTPSKKNASWVIAKFKDGEEWYPGKIAKRHDSGRCDITYDDGDFEVGVAPENVLSVGSCLTANINARGYKGCYEGVIKAINADGSCTISFDYFLKYGWGLTKVKPDAIVSKVLRTQQQQVKDFAPTPPPVKAALPWGVLIMGVAMGALGVAIMGMALGGK